MKEEIKSDVEWCESYDLPLKMADDMVNHYLKYLNYCEIEMEQYYIERLQHWKQVRTVIINKK